MKTARSALVLAGVMFLSMGLVFLGVALGVFKANERLMENGVSTQGVYTRVGSKSAWFEFEAEGRVWEKRSSVSTGFMREGDSVTVWYPEGRPDRARITTWETWGVFLIVGGVFSGMGLGFLIAMLPRILTRRSLMANGTKVTAQVTEVVQNRWVRINRRNPYVICAVCVHPYTGQEMRVRSWMLMNDPAPLIRDGQIGVLVDPMSEKRYYVLAEELQ